MVLMARAGIPEAESLAVAAVFKWPDCFFVLLLFSVLIFYFILEYS